MQRYHRIRRVFYPGLPDFPGHNVAMAQMRGYGGMLTMEVDGPDGITLRIVNQLKLFAIAPSLGGVESLATQPVTTSHHGLSSEELNRRGITDSMMRLSVGLEDSDDLIDAFDASA
jgi:cystathionine gamma-synthase